MAELDRERYDITEIPLNATMTDVAFAFDANILIVGQIPIQVDVRINDVGSPKMNLQIFRRLDMQIKRIFITTTTTSTTSLILFSSKDVSVDTAGFGNRAQLIDSVGTEYDARDTVETSVVSNATNINDGVTESVAAFTTSGYNKIAGFIFADQALTVTVEQGRDGTNWDEVTTIAYTASSTDGGFSVEIVAPYARLQFANASGTNTTACRKYAALSTGP